MTANNPSIKNILNAAEAPEWPTPEPIPSGLLPVDPFDFDLLPESIRSWVTDIAERMQCPPDFPAVAAMVALSSIIGRKACIRPKRRDDWAVIPNLWGVIVGRPGLMKSPALSEALKPLDRLEVEAGQRYGEAMAAYRAAQIVAELSAKKTTSDAAKLVNGGKRAEAEALLRDTPAGNVEPGRRRYKVTDTTVEALGEILTENPWGTLAYRDELIGLLKSLDKEGQEGARAFYLQGFDGNQGYTFDRIGRGKNLHIQAVCIAMLGGIQPGRLEAYIRGAVKGGAGDDGLLQRFGFLVWPDVTGEWINVDRWPDTPAKNRAYETFRRLDMLAPGTNSETGEDEPAVHRFDDDAQDVFDEWRAGLEAELRSGELHIAMESHLSKYRKLVPAVALVCSLADGEATVSKVSLLRALGWAEYLRSHAARAYGAGTRADTQAATSLLTRIKRGDLANGFKVREVYLKGWAHLATPDDARVAAEMLADLNYLRRMEISTGTAGGRPTIIYLINPAIRAEG